jgi:hypothetical protein
MYIGPDQGAYATALATYRDSELDVGFRALAFATNEYRAALHFVLPSSLNSAFIQRATLSLYYFDAWGSFNNRAIYAHRLLEPWTEFGTFFNIQRAPASSSALVGGQNFRVINWDVTDAARVWAANPATNFGLMLVASPGGILDNTFRFYSQRQSTNYTVLQIDYTVPPQITQQPVGQSASIGDNVSFWAFVGGTDSYSAQWQKDSKPIPGENSTLLNLNNVQLTNWFFAVFDGADG